MTWQEASRSFVKAKTHCRAKHLPFFYCEVLRFLLKKFTLLHISSKKEIALFVGLTQGSTVFRLVQSCCIALHSLKFYFLAMKSYIDLFIYYVFLSIIHLLKDRGWYSDLIFNVFDSGSSMTRATVLWYWAGHYSTGATTQKVRERGRGYDELADG